MKYLNTLSIAFIGIMTALATATALSASPVQTYNDVLVVINSNSTVSDEIGSYFASQRAIPSTNVARITVPAVEEITDAQFADLRSQLESIITSRNLTNSINYIVTTKGMPLKVKRADPRANASVESELTLILSKYAANIGRASRILSPYYGVRADFSRAAYGIYLVTRLDGYTSSDVHGLIDRASMVPSAVPSGAKFILDQDPSWNKEAPQLNTNLANASTLLAQKGLSATLNTTTTYLTRQTSVMGYASWGSNDYNWSSVTNQAKQYNTYLPTAIGETFVSTSGRSFTSPIVYGQSAVADMIAEGITGVKGYVYEPYATAITDVSKLFPMYADGYSLAESFYSASPYLSWMDVVIGDPKCRMINTRYSSASGGTTTPPPPPPPPATSQTVISAFTAADASNGVLLSWTTTLEVNNQGFDIERKKGTGSYSKIGSVAGKGNSTVPVTYQYTDGLNKNGTYSYRLHQFNTDGTSTYSPEISVQIYRKTVTTLSSYPNPFNPSTNISFTLEQSGHATLKVFNVIGQEVATLFNGQAEAGVENTVAFNASHLTSGVYFSVLESAGKSYVQKMLLSK